MSISPATILHNVEKTMQHYKIPPSRFGREAAGDPQLVFDLRRGRLPGARLLEQLSRYIQTGDHNKSKNRSLDRSPTVHL